MTTMELTLQAPPGQSQSPEPAAAREAPAAEPMSRRRVLGLAIPIIGENLLQTAVGAVDTFLVARLGAYAVAGVGIATELVFFVIAILSAIDIGATVLVAQAIGAGDRQWANHLARQAIVWGLLLALPASMGMTFAAPSLIALFGTAPDVAAAATSYLQIIAATAAVPFLSFVCGAVLRGAGDSRTPLKAAVVANIVNVAVSVVLIFGHLGLPALGVAGSAWGAVAGRTAGAALMLVLLASGRTAVSLRGKAGWRPRPDAARQIFSLGVPAACEQMLSSGAYIALVAVVALIGTAALAAQQITITALSVAFLPASAFSMAATALVGQSIGAGSVANARLAWSIAMRWAVALLAAGGLLAFLLAEHLLRLFTHDPNVVANGVGALRALGIALPVWGLLFVSAGSLRGSGDTRTPLVIGAATTWLSVVVAWLGVGWLDAGLAWVWIAFGIVTAPASLLMGWRFHRRIREYETGRRPLPDVSPAP